MSASTFSTVRICLRSAPFTSVVWFYLNQHKCASILSIYTKDKIPAYTKHFCIYLQLDRIDALSPVAEKCSSVYPLLQYATPETSISFSKGIHHEE